MFLFLVSTIHRISFLYHIAHFFVHLPLKYTKSILAMNTPDLLFESDMDAAPHTESQPETDYESESEYESDEDELYQDIEDAETEFENTEKHDGHYYLGTPWTGSHFMLMNGTVSVATFLGYEYSRILGYLRAYSVFYVSPQSQIEIMKLIVNPDQAYTTVIKTHWLRLVQRRWKHVYRERQRVIARRMSIQNQEYFRIHGRYLAGTRWLPSLRGMLSGLLPTSA